MQCAPLDGQKNPHRFYGLLRITQERSSGRVVVPAETEKVVTPPATRASFRHRGLAGPSSGFSPPPNLIMVSALEKGDRVFLHGIDQPVFLGNPSTPRAFERDVPERFRFPDPPEMGLR